MTLPIVVCDASVALKWFHEAGEEEVQPSRALLDAYADRRLDLVVLDLTLYEIGNVLVRALGLPPVQAVAAMDALSDICPRVAPAPTELDLAARLAVAHRLTFYDAAYAAVAQARSATLATLDRALLGAALGVRPSEIHTGPISSRLTDAAPVPQVVREGLEAHLGRDASRRRISFAAVGRSGTHDTAQNADAILEAEWTRDRDR